MKILSVIVPTYNMERYLDKCLSSLVEGNKNYLNILEVVVVNDGSKDRSLDIALRYKSQFPDSFVIVDKENGNYGSCINAALKILSGKYVKVLDSDDSFSTRFFPQFLNKLQTIEADLIITDYAKVDIDGNMNEIKSWKGELEENKIFPLENLTLIGIASNFQMHCITYRTELLKDINYRQTEGVSYSDVEWTFFPMCAVKNVFYIGNVLYLYLLGRVGQTVDCNVFRNKFNDIKTVFLSILRFYSKIEEQDSQRTFLRTKLEAYCNYTVYRNIFVGVFSEAQCRKLDSQIRDEIPSVYREMNNYKVEVNGLWLPLKYWRWHLICFFDNDIYRFIAAYRVKIGAGKFIKFFKKI